MMPERANRTFICSVLFLDIAEYSKKPVSEQIQLKDSFNALIAEAIHDIAVNDRIILDTGDGVAINFLGDPEDALFVAMSLREAFAPRQGEPPRLPARVGINLGPVRLVRDLNSQPNIIGDGINVAQRVMGFAQPGQILVSRSYYEVVSHISEGYSKLFKYEGSRTDKHVREHEVYSVGYSGTRANGVRSPAERAYDSSREGKRQASTATVANATAPRRPLLARIEPWLNNRTIAFGTATVSAGAFVLAVIVNLLGHGEVAAVPAPDADAAGTPGKSRVAARLAEAAPAAPPAAHRHAEKEKKPRTARSRTEAGMPAAAPEPAIAAHEDAAPVVGAEEKKKEAKPSPFAFFSRAAAPAAPEAAPPVPAGTALVTLAVAPWGEVYVDGDRIGVSPPVNEVEVTPGRRKIEIRNGNFPVYTQVIDVKADQKIRIKHKFN
ncbi:MAG TPA: adenylate/guanylate cyclase domain-containing protein [Burkholderiales bacterium]|nr:adenylate/guanylate cyclase domain-containing protein [Burkholderiales bacterium]